MSTFFDALTVACFVGLVGAFFRFTEKDSSALLRYFLSGIALAVANQIGNAGHVVLGSALVMAAIAYPWLSAGKPRRDS